MSFKFAFLFVVCFLALAGAIPVEKPEEVEDTKDAPVAAEPEKEAAEETSDAEEKEEESPSEDQEAEQEQEENDEEDKEEDEEKPEVDDTEEEPENEVEAKENDENDPTPGPKYRRYHPKCKYVRKKVYRCYKRLKCKGSYYSRRGRCCRKKRYCRYLWLKVRICQVCRRKCRHVCGYRRRKVCQPFRKCVWRRRRVRRGRRGYYRYQWVKYMYCKVYTKCRWLRYKFCQLKCYGYVCRYLG